MAPDESCPSGHQNPHATSLPLRRHPWLTEPPSPFGISGGAPSAIHRRPGRISLHWSGDPVQEKRAAELDRLQDLQACLAEDPYNVSIRLTTPEEFLPHWGDRVPEGREGWLPGSKALERAQSPVGLQEAAHFPSRRMRVRDRGDDQGRDHSIIE